MASEQQLAKVVFVLNKERCINEFEKLVQNGQFPISPEELMKFISQEDMHELQDTSFRLKLSSFSIVIPKVDSTVPGGKQLFHIGASCIEQMDSADCLASLGAYTFSVLDLRQRFTDSFSKWIRSVYSKADTQASITSERNIEFISKFAEHINIFTGGFAENSFHWMAQQSNKLRIASVYPVQLHILEMCCKHLCSSINFLTDFGAAYGITNIVSTKNSIIDEVIKTVSLDKWLDHLLKAVTNTNEVAWTGVCKEIQNKVSSGAWPYRSVPASLRRNGDWELVLFYLIRVYLFRNVPIFQTWSLPFLGAISTAMTLNSKELKKIKDMVLRSCENYLKLVHLTFVLF